MVLVDGYYSVHTVVVDIMFQHRRHIHNLMDNIFLAFASTVLAFTSYGARETDFICALEA